MLIMSDILPNELLENCEILEIVQKYLDISNPCLFNIYLEDTPKQIYVYKINADSSISGLIYDNYGDSVINPSETKVQNIHIYTTQPIWQFRTFFPNSFDMIFISHKSPDFDINQTFIKYGWDREELVCECLEWASNGGSWRFICFPVYKVNFLPICPLAKSTLVEGLEKIASERQDWHKDCPVLDIIDPDLNPNYYFAENLISEKVSEEFVDKNSERSRKNLERKNYAWFPFDIQISSDRTFKFLGEIHNLKKQGNEELYEAISEVFSKMLPGFEKLGFEFEEEKQIMQVVVKAQKYIIQPGTSYSGKWHLEGKTENIIAAGVYYCKINNGFLKDALAFHPIWSPCHDRGDINYNLEVPVEEDCAIVFENILPHRFLKLENTTDRPLERMFINFFIVDPCRELETNQLRIEAFEALKKISRLPKKLIEKILSFVYYWDYIDNAKEKREIARESMKNEKNGWGYIHYGNCGDMEYMENFESYYHKKIADPIEEEISFH